MPVDESCEVEVDEPSSDSPQLPVEEEHDVIQSKIDQGEFRLFFNELLFFACLVLCLFFSPSKYCRPCDTVNNRYKNLTFLKSGKIIMFLYFGVLTDNLS